MTNEMFIASFKNIPKRNNLTNCVKKHLIIARNNLTNCVNTITSVYCTAISWQRLGWGKTEQNMGFVVKFRTG